jgi:hypothetical protein
MEKNVGSFEKKIRIIIGAGLLIAGIFVQMGTGLRVVVLVVSGIAFATAFISF